MRTERLDLKHILGWGYNINMPGWSNKVRNHPKKIKKTFSEWGSMFFRNTLIAHKKPIKPYFTGRVVLQAIISVHKEIIV